LCERTALAVLAQSDIFTLDDLRDSRCVVQLRDRHIPGPGPGHLITTLRRDAGKVFIILLRPTITATADADTAYPHRPGCIQTRESGVPGNDERRRSITHGSAHCPRHGPPH